MANSEAPCSKQREILLEIFLSDGERANLPSELNRHLERLRFLLTLLEQSCGLYGPNTRLIRSIRLFCGRRL